MIFFYKNHCLPPLLPVLRALNRSEIFIAVKMVSANEIEKCLKSVGLAREKYILKPNIAAKADVWKHFLLGKSACIYVLFCNATNVRGPMIYYSLKMKT